MKLDESYTNYEVSSHTLRVKDLIENFMHFLKTHNHPDYFELNQKLRGCTAEDHAWFLWFDLCEVLEDMAPENCYFGSHMGDGALFGFWEMEVEEEEI